jgi:pyocin large subunit-like protein
MRQLRVRFFNAFTAVSFTLCLLMLCACQSRPGSVVPSPQATTAPSASARAATSERERWAVEARWAPGQLEAHFQKHGNEGPYSGVQDYDRAARETIRQGIQFTYVDRESQATRVGFYQVSANRFTSLSSDGQRITTSFHPDRRDAYVRGLDRSTYR